MAKKKTIEPIEAPIFSCPDWDERLERREYPLDVDKYLPFMNTERMDKCVEIISMLKIPDISGQPLRATADYFPEWQKTTFAMIAGGLQKNGEQFVKTALVCVPKKNDKTSGAASLMIALTMMSPRPNADLIQIGPTQSISELCYRQVVGIIQADPELAKLWHIQMHIKKCTFLPNKCSLQIKTLDSNVLTGTKAAVCLLDETFLMNTEEHARVVTQLKGSGAAIRESQVIMISTMSDKPASGFWKQELAVARAVRSGESDVSGFLPLIWEPSPRDMDDIAKVCTPAVWERCNPNINRSVSMPWLKQSFKAVLATNDDGELKRWLSQHVNAEISQFGTSLENQWPGAAPWMIRGDEKVTASWIIENCNRLIFGFDGGGAHDLTSLAILGLDDGGHMYLTTKSWLFEEAMRQDFTTRGALTQALRDGTLKVVLPGQEVDEIVELVVGIYNRNAMSFVGFGCDPAGIASEIANRLEADGIPRDKVIAIKQGWGLKEGWTQLYRRATRGSLTHGNQDLLNWAVANCKQEDNGLVTKKASGTAHKIDPAVACATAAVLAQNPPPVFDPYSMIA